MRVYLLWEGSNEPELLSIYLNKEEAEKEADRLTKESIRILKTIPVVMQFFSVEEHEVII